MQEVDGRPVTHDLTSPPKSSLTIQDADIFISMVIINVPNIYYATKSIELFLMNMHSLPTIHLKASTSIRTQQTIILKIFRLMLLRS